MRTLERLRASYRNDRLLWSSAAWGRTVLTSAWPQRNPTIQLHVPDPVQPPAEHRPLARRIMDAYLLMKETEQTVDPAFRPSTYWLTQLEPPGSLAPLAQAARAGDVDAFHHFLANYGSNPTYIGVHFGSYIVNDRGNAMKRRYWEKTIFRSQYEIWKWFAGPGATLESIRRPDIGNPAGAHIDGVLVTPNSFKHGFYAGILDHLVEPGGRFGELGGGDATLAYHLLKTRPDVRYSNFDLPEVACLAAYFLSRALPDRTVGLFGEKHEDADIAVLPAFSLAKECPEELDLFINTHSLGEIPADTAADYITEATRRCDWFFHINHEYGRTDQGPRQDSLLAGEYPVPADEFRLVWRQPEMLHALFRGYLDREFDAFIYLYGRRRPRSNDRTARS
jgi:hypothetical protein